MTAREEYLAKGKRNGQLAAASVPVAPPATAQAARAVPPTESNTAIVFIRMGPSLKERLAARAKLAGKSINEVATWFIEIELNMLDDDPGFAADYFKVEA